MLLRVCKNNSVNVLVWCFKKSVYVMLYPWVVLYDQLCFSSFDSWSHKNNDVDVFTNAMSVSVLSLDNRRWSWSKHSCRTVMLTSIATWDRTRQLSKNKLVIANSMREEYNVELCAEWYFVHDIIMYRWCTLKQLFCSGLRPKDSALAGDCGRIRDLSNVSTM